MFNSENMEGVMRLRLILFLLCLTLIPTISSQGFASKINLTEAEQSWLARHNVVRMHTPYGFPPVAFYEKDEWQGMFREYAQLVSERTGVRFEFVNFPFSQQEEKAKSREVDILHSYDIPERKKYMNFTRPFFTTAWVIVSRSETAFVGGIESLKDKKVAIIKGVRGYDYVVKKYPEISLLNVDSVPEAMEAVSSGKADAAIGPIINITYTIHQKRINNLKISGMTDYPNDPLMYAVRSDWPELQGIIDKALVSISEEEHKAILHKWVPLRLEHVHGWREIIEKMYVFIILIGLAILGLFVYWNRRLVREINNRRKAQEELRDSEKRYRLVSDYTHEWEIWLGTKEEVHYNSPSCERISGYPVDDFIADPDLFHKIIHPEDRELWLGHLATEKKAEIIFRIFTKKGEERIIEHICQPVYDVDGSYLGHRGSSRDITDRKKAENEVIEQRNLSNKYLQIAGVMMCTLNAAGEITLINKKGLDILGYQDEQELLGKNWFDVSLPENVVAEIKLVFNQLMSGNSQPVEYYENTVLTKNGEERTVAFHNTLLRDKEGKISGILFSGEDITMRKQAEEGLREKEVQYHNLADSGLALIWTSGTDKLCNYFNIPWLKFTGRTLEQEIGNGWVEGVHPDDLDSCVQTYVTAFDKHEPFDMEYRLRHVSGEYRWIRDMGTPNHDSSGVFIGYIGHCFDITDRRQAEDKLRDSETRFRQLANSTWEGIFVHRDGIILDVNQALTDIFGYDKAEVIGKNVLDFIANEFTEKARQLLKEDTQSSVLQVEGKGRKKDGTVFPIETLGRPISYNNLPARVIAIRDLTQQKQLEQAREKLEAQNRQLQKSESLSRMAASIAHHFNNQLGVVIGNLELAMMELPKGATTNDNLTSAMAASNKAAQMSGMMLTYLGQKSGQHEPLDISGVCQRSLPILRVVMPGNVVMETDIPSPGPVVSADENQIQQVLTNLVNNAREAIGDNKGTISLNVKTVTTAAIPTVHRYPIVWQPKDKGYACLGITDKGCGIEDKDIEKIFDPFFSTKFTGRGMGLAVVLGIVNAHGGVITVDSKPGMGSTFRVFLPISVEEVLRPPDKVTQAVAIAGSGIVLLVEDEEPLRNMAAAMLKRLGFTVLEAKDGVEAVELFRQHQDEIHFVISDLTMPRMDGWETLTALRKLKPGIPVILASGYDKAHVMAGDHPELPQVFLGKPYRLKGLSDAISEVLVNRN